MQLLAVRESKSFLRIAFLQDILKFDLKKVTFDLGQNDPNLECSPICEKRFKI
jgi:hypothetical protein